MGLYLILQKFTKYSKLFFHRSSRLKCVCVLDWIGTFEHSYSISIKLLLALKWYHKPVLWIERFQNIKSYLNLVEIGRNMSNIWRSNNNYRLLDLHWICRYNTSLIYKSKSNYSHTELSKTQIILSGCLCQISDRCTTNNKDT